ncbi:MAG: TolC family protein [Candidatus Zixiibacteriota bacterium]
MLRLCIIITLTSVALLLDICAGLSLDEALKTAIKSNYSVAVLESRVQEASRRINTARSAYSPRLELSGAYTYVSRVPKIEINLPLPVAIPEIKTGANNMTDTKLSGGYLLFDWGKRRKTVGQAILGKELSENALFAARQSVAYQVTRSYTGAALISEQIKLLQQYATISQKHLDDAQIRFDNGLVSQFDLLKSEMQLKVFQEQLSIAQADLKIALRTLAEILGTDSVSAELSQPLSYITLSEPLPDENTWAGQIAAKPEIIANRKQQEISNLALGMEKLRPIVTLFGSAGWKNGYMPDPDELLFNYAGGVAVNYAFFNGGFSKSRRAEELAKQAGLELEIARIESEARTAVSIYREEVAKIASKSRITAEKLALARKAMEIASVSYGNGSITNAEYLDTELQVQQIELEALQDKFNLLMAQNELKRALSYWPELL